MWLACMILPFVLDVRGGRQGLLGNCGWVLERTVHVHVEDGTGWCGWERRQIVHVNVNVHAFVWWHLILAWSGWNDGNRDCCCWDRDARLVVAVNGFCFQGKTDKSILRCIEYKRSGKTGRVSCVHGGQNNHLHVRILVQLMLLWIDGLQTCTPRLLMVVLWWIAPSPVPIGWFHRLNGIRCFAWTSGCCGSCCGVRERRGRRHRNKSWFVLQEGFHKQRIKERHWKKNKKEYTKVSYTIAISFFDELIFWWT